MSEDLHMMNDDLLVKYLLDECDAQEQLVIEAWLEKDAANKIHYIQLKNIWEQSKQLNIESEINEEEAWLRLKAKMIKTKKQFSITRYFYYAAASVLLFVAAFSIYKYADKKSTIPQLPIVHVDTTIQSSATKLLIDTLSDKSVVTLNKETVLKYPEVFTAKERRVHLQGEAFFSITPDKTKPFYINTMNDVEIKVVGTSFNVKSYDAYTEVVVETGIVEVRKFDKVVLLHPNERARIDKNDSSIVVLKSKDKLYKHYRSKEFECNNTPLWKLVEVLNEAYQDSVVINNKELKGLTLTTRFDNESLATILEILSETFDITVEKKGNIYILK